jgi:hypothetical protein
MAPAAVQLLTKPCRICAGEETKAGEGSTGRGPPGTSLQPLAGAEISYEKGFELKLSGDEVYYTACSLLVVLKNSCGKLHCEKGFNLIPFSFEI